MSDSVVQRCDDAGRLADLVNGAGPVKVLVTTDKRVIIQRNSDEVDVIDDPALAAFFAAAPNWLRTLSEAVATIYTRHTPLRPGGMCPECGRLDPCDTRQLLDVRIRQAPAAASRNHHKPRT